MIGKIINKIVSLLNSRDTGWQSSSDFQVTPVKSEGNDILHPRALAGWGAGFKLV